MKEGDSYEGRESNEGGGILWIVWRRENHMKEGESYEGGRILWRRGDPMEGDNPMKDAVL